MVEGDGLRDWREEPGEVAVFPYRTNYTPIDVENEATLLHYMWPYRSYDLR